MKSLRGKGDFVVVDKNYKEWARATDWGLKEIGRMGYSITPINWFGIEDFYERPGTVVSLIQSEEWTGKVYLRVDWLGRSVRYFELKNYSEIAQKYPYFIRRLRENIVVAYNHYHRRIYPDGVPKAKFTIIH